MASSTPKPKPNCSIASCALGTPIRATLRGTTTSCTSKHPNATRRFKAGQLRKIPATTLVSARLQKLRLMYSNAGYVSPPLKTSKKAERSMWRHDAISRCFSVEPVCAMSALKPDDAIPIASSGPSGLLLSTSRVLLTSTKVSVSFSEIRSFESRLQLS
ncbi:hypothetical protein KC360_g200 [Hortaea werneckii]|nr:hypothetical protein KC360_g200 [Hortaea werneckii]